MSFLDKERDGFQRERERERESGTNVWGLDCGLEVRNPSGGLRVGFI